MNEELIYSNSSRGYALCSMRSAERSRYYIQVPLSDRTEDWSDDGFWDELKRRLPEEAADTLVTGPSIEKTIAPLRSFVCEPMRWGRLFLCGDAAHIVPPTGAKGLNTAASDVHYLYHALAGWYGDGDGRGTGAVLGKGAGPHLEGPSGSAGWMTTLLHRFPDQSDFDRRIQKADLAFLRENEDAQRAMATNYVGLPY